jgi:hypothetical protein
MLGQAVTNLKLPPMPTDVIKGNTKLGDNVGTAWGGKNQNYLLLSRFAD